MRVSSADLLRNFGPISDAALSEPIVVTKNGRDRLALISFEEFTELQRVQGIFKKLLEAYLADERSVVDGVKLILDAEADLRRSEGEADLRPGQRRGGV